MSRLILGLVIVSSFFVVPVGSRLGKDFCKALRTNVLVHASRPDVASNKALMTLMIALYRSKTYEDLKATTYKLKNTLDSHGSQTIADVEFVTFLDVKQAQSPRRRRTI